MFLQQNSDNGKTFQDVVKKGLCIGCGTCVGICPQSCIQMHKDVGKGLFIPKKVLDNCTFCGACFEVCPGINVNFKKLNRFKFNKEPDNLIGNYLRCYIGYAVDPEIRKKAASGGLITALTRFALENEFIDGAIVTNFESPSQPCPVIINKNDDVLSASGSKYCPVPVNLLLNDVLKKPGKYLLVGLPCHMAGLNKAQLLNSELRQRVPYCFGIVCNHAPTFHATEYLLRRFKIEKKEVQKISYRGNGWPSGITITLKSGSQLFLPQFSPHYWGFIFERFFWANRCLICEDKLCELADISFMDAWLPEMVDDKTGLSLIIVRSEKGNDLIKRAMVNGAVNLSIISPDKILQSQSMSKVAKRVVSRKQVTRLIMKLATVSNKFDSLEKTNSSLMDSISALIFVLINKFCDGRSLPSLVFMEFYLTCWSLLVSLKRFLKPA